MQGLQTSRDHTTALKAQLREVRHSPWLSFDDMFSNLCSFLDTVFGSSFSSKVADGSSTAAPNSSPKSEAQAPKASEPKTSDEPSPTRLASEETISAFMSQVSSLVK